MATSPASSDGQTAKQRRAQRRAEFHASEQGQAWLAEKRENKAAAIAEAKAIAEEKEKVDDATKDKAKTENKKTKKPRLTPLEINLLHKEHFIRRAVERGEDLRQYFNCSAHPAWFINRSFDDIECITRLAYDRAMSRPGKAYTLCDLDTLLSRLEDWFYRVDKVRIKDVHMDAAMYRAYVNILGPDAYMFTTYIDPNWVPGETEDQVRQYLRKVVPDSALVGPDSKTVVWPREMLEKHIIDILKCTATHEYVTRPIANALRDAYNSMLALAPVPVPVPEPMPNPIVEEEEYERYYDDHQGKPANKPTNKPKSVYKAAFA